MAARDRLFRFLFVSAALLFLQAGPVFAHFHTFTPDNEKGYGRPGDAITWDYFWGHPYELILFDAETPEFHVVSPEGKKQPVQLKETKTIDPDTKRKRTTFKVRYTPEQIGDSWLCLEAPDDVVEEEGVVWRDYVKQCIHVMAEVAWDPSDASGDRGEVCFGTVCGDSGPAAPADTGGTPPPPVDTDEGGPDATTPPPGPDVVVGPDVPEEPDCVTAADCPAGWRCEVGECVEPQDCETTGTCPVENGANIVVNPVGDLWFSYMPGAPLPVQRTVDIANDGTGTLEIYDVDLMAGTPPDFDITDRPALPLRLESGDMARVEVTFTETSPLPGPGTLSILSSDPDQSSVRVRLLPQPKGRTETPVPCIQVYPTSLDFGRMERGQSLPLDFTIQSCGTAVLMVQEIRRGAGFFGMLPLSDEFQLTPPPVGQMILAPTQSATQTITFTAGLAGLKTGHFTVVSTDPDQPDVDVAVKAESTAPAMETQGIHIQLDWDSDNCDVDMHLIRPGGTFYRAPGDCYYGNMSPDWGTAGDYVDDPFLDVDNVWGFGPENTNLQEPLPGVYKVVIHYYSDSYNGSNSTSTNATVRVYHYGQLAGEFGPVYLDSTGAMWDVCTIDWPSRTIVELGDVYTR